MQLLITQCDFLHCQRFVSKHFQYKYALLQRWIKFCIHGIPNVKFICASFSILILRFWGRIWQDKVVIIIIIIIIIIQRIIENFVRNIGGQFKYYPNIYLGLRDNSFNIAVTPAEIRTSFFPIKGIQHCRYANPFAVLCESGRSYN